MAGSGDDVLGKVLDLREGAEVLEATGKSELLALVSLAKSNGHIDAAALAEVLHAVRIVDKVRLDGEWPPGLLFQELKVVLEGLGRSAVVSGVGVEHESLELSGASEIALPPALGLVDTVQSVEDNLNILDFHVTEIDDLGNTVQAVGPAHAVLPTDVDIALGLDKVAGLVGGVVDGNNASSGATGLALAGDVDLHVVSDLNYAEVLVAHGRERDSRRRGVKTAVAHDGAPRDFVHVDDGLDLGNPLEPVHSADGNKTECEGRSLAESNVLVFERGVGDKVEEERDVRVFGDEIGSLSGRCARRRQADLCVDKEEVGKALAESWDVDIKVSLHLEEGAIEGAGLGGGGGVKRRKFRNKKAQINSVG